MADDRGFHVRFGDLALLPRMIGMGAKPNVLSCALRRSDHTLRHSFAAHLLEDGTDIRVIQVPLGQAKLDNTAFCTKVATRTVRTVTSSLDRLGLCEAGEIAAGG